jgi:hypothetical protein
LLSRSAHGSVPGRNAESCHRPGTTTPSPGRGGGTNARGPTRSVLGVKLPGLEPEPGDLPSEPDSSPRRRRERYPMTIQAAARHLAPAARRVPTASSVLSRSAGRHVPAATPSVFRRRALATLACAGVVWSLGLAAEAAPLPAADDARSPTWRSPTSPSGISRPPPTARSVTRPSSPSAGRA